MRCRSGVCLLIFASLIAACVGDAPADEVMTLPGMTWKPMFRQYSGFLNATGTKKLHYWFIQSDMNPKTDPVVLWMNGGPGCSSLDGLLSEHGPFLINDDGMTLSQNPFSWNKAANMLYLEAPAGVGFSYSDDMNYTTDDDQTSLNNYMALKSFFTMYPEYSTNDFYITGESYAGIYIPTLAVRVLADMAINFKGVAIGNGVTEWSMLDNALVYYVYGHALVDQTVWSAVVVACCKNGNSSFGNCNFTQQTGPCPQQINQMGAGLNDLNPYNIYQECFMGELKEYKKHRVTYLPPLHHFDRFRSSLQNRSNFTAVVIPCEDTDAITRYLTQPAVRQALHIPAVVQDWTICAPIDYTSLYDSMRTQYQQILQTGKYRMLVYNGDFDTMCNYLGDEWFVDSLNQPLTSPSMQWYYSGSGGSKQVGGFVKKYKNITFATVKGAGHMVPSDKPNPALVMFKNFLSGQF